MKPHFLFILFVSFVFASCQNSQEQQRQQEEVQKKHDDSITNAAVEQERLRAEQERLAAERESDKKTLKQILISLKSDLEAAETKMESVKSFHLLRDSDEKEAQVRAQSEVINTLKVQIEEAEEALKKNEAGLDYTMPTE